MLLNISCKGGSLRVTPDGFLVHTSMTGKSVWQIPARGIIITEVSRKVMATIEVRGPQGSRLVEWVSPSDIVKLQQTLAQVQTMPIYPQNLYTPDAPTYQPQPQPQYPHQYSSQPQQPQYPYQQSGRFGQPPAQAYSQSKQPPKKPTAWQWYRAQRKAARRGIGCGVIVAILLFIGMCSSIVSAASNTGNQASSNATPTSQVVPQAASSTATDTVMATAPATATPTPKPKPTATPRPTNPPAQPTPTSAPAHAGVNGNPWGYDFNSTNGSMIYNPPAAFCSYFACITTFWNGHGYVDQCADGDYSKSGGLSGACSHHGGESQPLYSH
ncbi:MAG TPA: hypothetical protein VN729_12935 [Ktedonobacteraceae bacterium]|nr:hypothetical protein [Ktedonobacteraceae bacterium]